MQEFFELVAQPIFEFVFSTLLRTPGLLFVNLFWRDRQTEADGCLVASLSLIFWCTVAGCLWAFFS